MQGQYEHYGSYPRNAVKSRFKLQKEVEAALRAGEKRVFTDIAFVTEEPTEFAGSEGPIMHSFLLSAGLGSRPDDVALCRSLLHLQTAESFPILGHITGPFLALFTPTFKRTRYLIPSVATRAGGVVASGLVGQKRRTD